MHSDRDARWMFDIVEARMLAESGRKQTIARKGDRKARLLATEPGEEPRISPPDINTVEKHYTKDFVSGVRFPEIIPHRCI